MYEKILFPTDGSESANEALTHALTLAKQFDSTLHVLYVVNTTYRDAGATGTSLNELRERGQQTIEAAQTEAESAGVGTEAHIKDGDPYREIIELGDSMDVIVMATRGRSGIDRYLLGSVTEKVVRASDTPVFTVRSPEAE